MARFFMNDIEHARLMLRMAFKDLKSLKHMLNPEEHDEEIFGFHAQQAIEKALKAWIGFRQEVYPHSHNLGILLQQLEDGGEDVQDFWELLEWTAFGVQFRYQEYFDPMETCDRPLVVTKVSLVLSRVSNLLSSD